MKKTEMPTEQQADDMNDTNPTPESLVPVEPATLTPEQFEELKERAAKADENWERLLRTTADFDNFKKRAAREKVSTPRRIAARAALIAPRGSD